MRFKKLDHYNESDCQENIFDPTQSSVINTERMVSNLIPYPRIHFMSPSFSPFISEIDKYKVDHSIDKITDSWLNKSNYMIKFDENSRSISAMLSYSGDVSYSEVVKTFSSVKERLNLLNWSPTGILSSLSKFSTLSIDSQSTIQRSVSLVNNSCSIWNVFSEIAHKHDLLYSKRGFCWFFVGYGMERDEHRYRREDLESLIKDYEELSDEIDQNTSFEDDY